MLFRPTSLTKVLDRPFVRGKEADSRTVLGRHVRDGRTVSNGQRGDARPVKLDKLVDHAELAKVAHNREHEVRRGRKGRQRPGKLVPDDLGKHHRDGLTEHRGFRLNATDAPAEHTKSVHHWRVRVGSDEGVQVQRVVRRKDKAGQVLKVDLVHDARAGRHDAHIVEGVRTPLEKDKTLSIAAKLSFKVELQRVRRAKLVNLHGMVNHKVDRHPRLNRLGIAAQASNRVAHGSEIDDSRDASKILKKDARKDKLNFSGAGRRGVPVEDRFDVCGREAGRWISGCIAHSRLEDKSNRKWQLGHAIIIQ
mmetsp:Transcript_5439/g.17589  ORF Transcript_5439/g.17589 Transcript_5439/m.17589 type:complete len:307 (-) Transcript_5439:146-1066(-)